MCGYAPARPASRPPAAPTWTRSAKGSGSRSASAAPTATSRWPRPAARASGTAPPPSATETSSTPARVSSRAFWPAPPDRPPSRSGRRGSPRRDSPAPGTGQGCGLRRALTELTPESLLDDVEAAEVRGRGGAGFPAGTKWRFTRAAVGEEKFIVANGDEGDPGSYIDKYLMERNPALVLEGMALAGFAVGAAHGFIMTRSEYPLSKPRLDAEIERARADGWLGRNILGTGFDFDIMVLEGAGSYVVGEETALLACLQGLRGTVSARPPFPAERGILGRPTVVNNTETLANIPFVAARGSDAYRALSPDVKTTGSKLVCFNERFVRPNVYEVPFGLSVRELCEDVAGGLRDGRTLKAVQIGGPLGGILPASRLDTLFDFDALAAEGCMVGHGSILAFDDTMNMRDVARHLLRFGAHESCGKCFPCRIGLQRAHDMFAAEVPVQRGRLEELLEALELSSLCAHGSGMPAPLRSLLAHFPDELGLA